MFLWRDLEQMKREARVRFFLSLQLCWLVMASVLGGWWIRIVIRQSEFIDRLFIQNPNLIGHSTFSWYKVRSMVFWESLTFFVLLLGTLGLSLWFYWRDLKRTRALESFFTGFTHELKTPLTSIRLQAEALSDTSTAEQNVYLKRLLSDATRLENQVEKTLELARIEGGGTLFVESIGLAESIRRYLVGVPLTADTLNISETLSIRADETALRIILKNIVENTRIHSKNSNAVLTFTASENDTTVVLNCTDNGENSHNGSDIHLGELFSKGARSSGTGVGLYLIRTLMQRMGGKAVFSKNHPSGFQVQLEFQKDHQEAHV